MLVTLLFRGYGIAYSGNSTSGRDCRITGIIFSNDLREMAPKRTTRTTPATETATTTSVTNAQLQAMIEQGVTTALAARDANRSMNGEDNHNSGTGTEGVVKLTQWFERMETSFCISNCTVDNQVKFSTCTLLGVALTWWKSHVKTVGHDIAYAMTWTDLKKKMTDKYCPRGEIKKLEAEMFPEESDKVERYVGGLPDMIHGSIVASKPKTMQKAIEMATELMDKKISTLAKRQAENKRKFDDTSRNIQNQQRQENKRSTTNDNNQRGTGIGQKPTCYKCGARWHFKRDCPKLKNNNHGMVTLGRNANAPAKVIQAYDAIPSPQAIIALLAVLPLLSLPPMFNSRDFFPSEEIPPLKDTETPVESPISVSLSSLSPVRSTTSPPNELSKVVAESTNSLWVISPIQSIGTDNQEKDEKQSQNDKTGLGMEKL
ncbi:reverse transcriptase domain-containing protein [Tanacetum coccineum]